MNVLVVFNHPYEKSFCAAILASVQTGLRAGGHDCDVIYLDRDDFDPAMRSKDLQAFVLARTDSAGAEQMLDAQVLNYRDRLHRAEHLVFVFPIWWELMPALMKGFVDKVIFPGIAYDQTSGRGVGMVSKLTALKGVTVITTMNTPSIIYRFLFGNAIKRALLTGTFWKIGVRNRKWISFSNVKSRTNEKRQAWLTQIEHDMRSLA
ncbi:NAD(P)H dehydrogenase (quinone) [Rhizobium sp. PDO1-076]|uniref:NAD(P)H-dependent oxidoreductase n=1 Tax=Rhizobium sp. PDO1-076 TaxID=1125979 RepID=UPI00024E3749|nr:NAD(P)H-dependent oxidoreductase [Rhizobium sp. PDO1-076]EHS52715.1 NAD(P)H dehydrogenase (quinone) [Rhizobium sp. PDO1-076]